MENSIVGVIFTIMMSASMVRDLTGAPFKHLAVQSLVLMLMAAAACFVTNVSPLAAFPVNLLMIFVILYSFTYEYASHIYFPYILSYLFLVFISPIQPDQLPKRLLGAAVGAAAIILYQIVNGRKRIAETAQEVLMGMMDQAQACTEDLLNGRKIEPDARQLRQMLCKLSQIVYDRRKKALCISDASFAMIDSGRGLENLVLLLGEMKGPIGPDRKDLLKEVFRQMAVYRDFMGGMLRRFQSQIGLISGLMQRQSDMSSAAPLFESICKRWHRRKRNAAITERRYHYRFG